MFGATYPLAMLGPRLERAGVPIAAPSANLFGHVSPTTARHVLDDLDGRIELVLDGGPTGVGVEATVLDRCGDGPRILRPGGASRQDIQACIGALLPAEAPGDALRSPGLLEKHYAPRAALKVLPDLEAIRAALDDCGLRPGDVDGLVSYTIDPVEEIELARSGGLRDLAWASRVPYGGGGSQGVVVHAAAAVGTPPAACRRPPPPGSPAPPAPP